VDDLGVDDPHPVLSDRAHAQLGLERHPELAHDDHVQRRAQRLRHLERDRDPAPRQAKDNDGLAPQVPEPGGKPPSRIITIGENHHDSSGQASPPPGRYGQGPWSPPGQRQAAARAGRAGDTGHASAAERCLP
jgi:hypothetical protein